MLKKAPHPSLITLIRWLPLLWTQPPWALVKIRETYGDIMRLGFHPAWMMHLVSHPDYIGHVLQTKHRNYRKKSLYHNHLFRPVLGNGLVNSEGELWLRQRRMIQPGFHHERLVSLVPKIVSEVKETLDRWEDFCARGESLDVYEAMMLLARRVNGQIIFSHDRVGEVVDQARKAFSQGARFLLLTGGKIPSARRKNFHMTQTALDRAVWQEIQRRLTNPPEGEDLLAMLFQARDRKTGEPMPLSQLRDELMTLIFAGYETTEKALAWSLYLLSQNPEAENRVLQEVEEVLAGREPAFQDIPRLAYTYRVIQEALRLYPPAWIQGRQAIEADTLGGYHIPAGSYIVMNQFGVHRHPDFWEQPDRFDPDRFLPDRSQNRPRFAYNPFGGGPRQCIGNDLAMMEAQIVLAMVVQRYRLRGVPDHPVELEPEVTLKPRFGLKIKLEKPDANAIYIPSFGSLGSHQGDATRV